MIVWTPDRRRELAEACWDDFGRLAYDGFGIMLSDQQLEFHQVAGGPTPRKRQSDPKIIWLSGGQRGGKTVEGFLFHADACLYKRGYDNTNRRQWDNYDYGTLAVAPTDQLALRLWTIGDEIAKGTNDAQYDRKARRSRGGAFIGKLKAAATKFGGIWRFDNGARTDFRSTEGWAYRLEGGQWWFSTWDEWASQPDQEIEFVRTEVLLGRLRDHDAKLIPMAWPKAKTEHHLMRVVREIQSGADRDSRVFYLDAAQAFFTNKEALQVELRRKSKASIERTIHGRPAGGAGIEFKEWQLDNMFRDDVTLVRQRESGYDYLHTFDLGIAHDATVGITWRIPIVGGKRVVTPEHKARIVDYIDLPGGPTQSLDAIGEAVINQQSRFGGQSAIDATSMGGAMAVRWLDEMQPRPHPFKANSNDRVHGNIRLAAITNGIDCLTWGRSLDEDDPEPSVWGLVEAPGDLHPLRDQMAAFDRDDKKLADDRVWAWLIGCWFIRRWWTVGNPRDIPTIRFDLRDDGRAPPRRRTRGKLVAPAFGRLDEGVAQRGIVYIGPDEHGRLVRVDSRGRPARPR